MVDRARWTCWGVAAGPATVVAINMYAVANRLPWAGRFDWFAAAIPSLLIGAGAGSLAASLVNAASAMQCHDSDGTADSPGTATGVDPAAARVDAPRSTGTD